MDRLDETSAKICGVCGRAFTKTAHLIRHSRSHAEEKPFSCSVCNKGFARTDALQRHERTLHSAKRRRTGSTFAADSSDGADPADPASQATDVFPSAETFAANPMGVHSWYGEQQGNGLLSTSTGIVDMGLMEAVVPNSISPQSSFFSAFPTSAIPSTGPEVNDMIAEWLNQDTGILASDRALAALFSTPNDTEHQSTGLGGGHVSVQPASSRPFSSHGTAQGDSSLNTTRQPYTSEWLLQSQGPQAQHGRSPVDSNPGVDGPRSVPRSTATARSASNTRTILVADTWESGVTIPHSSDYSSSRPGSPQPPELTSPEQVVGQLEFRGQYASINTQDRDTVIPSMKFLDVCLHLYFRCFHPTLPVIHRPSFHRDRASWHVLLSMCSIGCMFVGTQSARDSGRWIHQRLHLSTVLARDTDMALEGTRAEVIISSILGQAFSFLYGQPKQMLTAETYHEPLCTMARRSGLFTKIKPNPMSYDDIEHVDSATLIRKWKQWARNETLRRVTLGITIQGAESTVYSGVARLISAEVTPADHFSDALFEAEDAETWRALLGRLERGQEVPDDTAMPATPEIFQPTVLLSQALVHCYMLRQLAKTPFGESLPLRELSGFFDYTMPLAKDVGILHTLSNPRDAVAPHKRSFAVLWHYLWVVRLAPTSLIEEVAGRTGSPSPDSLLEVQAWVTTPAARLATLHCGHILSRATDLNDLGFLLPRVIFQATVVLLCYCSFVHLPVEPAEVIDILKVVEWERLVHLYDLISGDASKGGDGVRSVPSNMLQTPQERYLAKGLGVVRVPGFIEGKEKHMDTFSLRSASNLLLRRCTPWGIGATLGDILSNISF